MPPSIDNPAMDDAIASRQYTIADVERDTGLGKDTLRVWERRYGFPNPARDAHGERQYDQPTLERLRLICRLMLHGHRPGKLVPLDAASLAALAPAAPPSTEGAAEAAERRAAAGAAPNLGALVAKSAPAPAPGNAAGNRPSLAEDPALAALHAQDSQALRRVLAQALEALGLHAFTLHRVAPLVRQVGQAWVDGVLGVHQEHLFTEVVQTLLRQALYALPPLPAPARPRVLLATLPGEPHGLGLLMAEVMLSLEGCVCTSLGVQTPVDALATAARALPADIVALSASSAMPERLLLEQASELRNQLPAGTALWLGGEGSRLRRGQVPPWHHLGGLLDIATAVQQWRASLAP